MGRCYVLVHPGGAFMNDDFSPEQLCRCKGVEAAHDLQSIAAASWRWGCIDAFGSRDVAIEFFCRFEAVLTIALHISSGGPPLSGGNFVD